MRRGDTHRDTKELEEIRLLLIEDNEIGETYANLLRHRGASVRWERTVEDGIRAGQGEPFDVALVDMLFPGEKSGLDAIPALRKAQPDLRIIGMSMYVERQVVEGALALGAHDFYFKSDDLQDLFRRVALHAATLRRMRKREELQRLRAQAGDGGFYIGEGRVWHDARAAISQAVASDLPVLIVGETGTGKTALAQRIHDESRRWAGPFEVVSLSNVPETIADDELWGHEKGAFTGADAPRPGAVELAASGTLFLDEVGELTPLLQVKLLKVVEGLAYKRLGGSSWLCATARVIAATQRLAGPGAGTLRPDLYHRLASIRINLPPLRARPEDIAPLASRLLRRTFPERRLELATDALDALARHHWPGNVRELHHVLLRAVQRTEGRDLLRAEHVVLNEDAPAWTAGDHDARARHARAVLDQVGGVRRRAAEVLGIDEKTLRKLLREGGEPDA